ncbi:MAG: phospholipase D-like domain-containing protein [Chloroflexia bacterium]
MSSRKQRLPSPWYLLLLLLLAVFLGLYQAGLLGPLGLGPAPAVITAPAGSWFQPFFTAPDFSDQTPHRDGLDARVAADIEAAREQVDIASFEFNLESITQALLRAHERGVRVRLVLDGGNLNQEEMKAATDRLRSAGIPIVFDERQAFMHDKFVIIDRHILWVGSWNLTENDTYRNNNNLLRFDLPQLAENYTAEFEEMFLDGRFGPRSPENTPYPVLQLSDGTRIETYFAPEENVRGAIMSRLREAKEEIVFLAFSFTDDDIARVLLEKAREGVRVRGVLESRQENPYSEYTVLRKAGLDVRLDGNPRTMHHKVFVIDGLVTITGSYNFSKNAAEENDENLLVIENAGLARAYLEEFERVYQAAQKE